MTRTEGSSKDDKNINKTTLGPQNKYLEYQKKH